MDGSSTKVLDITLSLQRGLLRGVPILPTRYIRREQTSRELRSVLLRGIREPGDSDTVRRYGLCGGPGSGKTVLAVALARDIARYFASGAVWITVGHTPQLVTLQNQLAHLLYHEEVFADEREGRTRLVELLAELELLLVLDDVREKAHIQALDVIGRRGRLLVTTRDHDVLSGPEPWGKYDLKELTDAQARTLLASWSGYEETELPSELARLAATSGSPLALSAIGAILYQNERSSASSAADSVPGEIVEPAAGLAKGSGLSDQNADASRDASLGDMDLARLEKLFNEVVQLPPEEQPAFIDKACGDNDVLQHRLRDVLGADGSSSLSSLLNGEPSGLEPGIVLEDRFRLVGELGRGGMGTVFLAHDEQLRRPVAIKFLDAPSETLAQRFLREARLTAQCQHENIVKIYDLGQYQKFPYMILEYLQGVSLRLELDSQTALSDLPGKLRAASPEPGSHDMGARGDVAISRIVPVVRALCHAHERGIMHRDLKPDNIFLTSGNTIKVLDFGIAKALVDEYGPHTTGRADRMPHTDTREVWATQQGQLFGTPSYMSPEQWRGEPVGPATDIWAVGLILWELLTGKHPIPFMSRLALQSTIADVETPMPSLARAMPALGEIAAIVDRCLQKRVSERFQQADELLSALESVVSREEAPKPLAATSQHSGSTETAEALEKHLRSVAQSGPAAIWRTWREWHESGPVASNLSLPAAEYLIALSRADLALKVLQHVDDSTRARQLRAVAYARTGADDEAMTLLETLYRQHACDSETMGLLAGRYKKWWQDSNSIPCLERAADLYREAFESFGDVYNGINAAALALYLDNREHSRQLVSRVIETLDSLPRNDLDHWKLATYGEAYHLLEDMDKARYWYNEALKRRPAFHDDVAVMRRQARCNAGFLGQPTTILDNLLVVPRVVAFVGHMEDTPDREIPRFPPALVPRVRDAIRESLRALNAGFGYSSLARGSDILFVEAMLGRRGQAIVYLPFPVADFERTSVGPNWRERFRKLLANPRVEMRVLSDESLTANELPAAFASCTRFVFNAAIARAENLDDAAVLVAVWDGDPGDGPGGTADAVAHWRQGGHELVTLNIREL